MSNLAPLDAQIAFHEAALAKPLDDRERGRVELGLGKLRQHRADLVARYRGVTTGRE